MSARTLLIGLDGATFEILDDFIAAGVMPHLQALLAQGVRADLMSVIPPLTPPSWTSIMTGRSPGTHGIFDFMRFELQGSERTLRVLSAKDVQCETLWSLASRSGKTVSVLNFPMTYPPPAINGQVVPGWVPWRHLRLACHPAGLFDQLKAQSWFNARDLAMDMSLEERALEGCHSKEDYQDWLQLHERREGQWFNIFRYLEEHESADLTAILFDGVDKLQHFCWRFIDQNCFPAEPDAWEVKIRDLCRRYFRSVDEYIGAIVTAGGDTANTIIVSDHGFGPTNETFFVNAWLQQQGYLAWKDLDQIREKHPETLGIGTMARRFYEVDWQRTVAYCPTPSSNGIFLFGAHGRATGQAQAQLSAELCEGLRSVLSPSTGKPAITDIWTQAEAFQGAQMPYAPDLTLGLADGGFVSILPSTSLFKPREEPFGTHRPNGVFMAHGPCFAKAASLAPISVLDVTPTVLYSLGLPIPADLEGQVPLQGIDPAWLRARPVQSGAPTRRPQAGPASPAVEGDAELSDEVLKQLKALGYME